MIKLTKKQILTIHTKLLQETGGGDGLRDEGLLESALEALCFRGFVLKKGSIGWVVIEKKFNLCESKLQICMVEGIIHSVNGEDDL
jgi:hypothetical protein